MKPAPNPFRWQTRIRFIDTDASGRIHYTAMFRYFESAEIEFFRTLGITYDVRHSYAFPRVHVEADYYAFIVFDDLLTFELSIAKIGHSSVHLQFHVLRDSILVASGMVVIVCTSTETRKSIEIPASVRNTLQAAQASHERVS